MEKYFNINAEKYSIRCKLYGEEKPDVRRVIVFCHGFGGHKDNKAAARFAGHVLEKNKGTAVITFNWPCHGDDARKTLTLSECDTYLRLVLSHISEKFDAPELFCYATSFGGYLVLKYIAEHGNPFRRIALRCPAVNMYESFTGTILSPEELSKLQKGKNAAVGFDRKVEIGPSFLSELRENDITKLDFLPWADDLMILHGTKDEIIPFAAARAFAEDNVIDFIPVEGADHRFVDPRKMDFAIARIAEHFGMK